jgi:quercetin dioxygenase-like cupin family protein
LFGLTSVLFDNPISEEFLIMKHICLLLCFLCFTAISALAQDPVKVDPKHYTVESENAEVRVLRIRYGPHEKSVMHRHPEGVVIMLTDANLRFHLANGKSEDRPSKAGETRPAPAETHLPENLSDQPFEAILVEFKGKAAKSTQRKKP